MIILKDLLSAVNSDERVTIELRDEETDDRVRPFRIEWVYAGDVKWMFPEWLNAFVTHFTMDNDGDYVITIVPDDKEEQE